MSKSTISAYKFFQMFLDREKEIGVTQKTAWCSSRARGDRSVPS